MIEFFIVKRLHDTLYSYDDAIDWTRHLSIYMSVCDDYIYCGINCIFNIWINAIYSSFLFGYIKLKMQLLLSVWWCLCILFVNWIILYMARKKKFSIATDWLSSIGFSFFFPVGSGNHNTRQDQTRPCMEKPENDDVTIIMKRRFGAHKQARFFLLQHSFILFFLSKNEKQ